MNVRTLVRCHWSRSSQMLLSSTPLSRFINVPAFLPIRWMASASITFLLVICCSLPITLACQWIACVVSSTCSATAEIFPCSFPYVFPVFLHTLSCRSWCLADIDFRAVFAADRINNPWLAFSWRCVFCASHDSPPSLLRPWNNLDAKWTQNPCNCFC